MAPISSLRAAPGTVSSVWPWARRPIIAVSALMGLLMLRDSGMAQAISARSSSPDHSPLRRISAMKSAVMSST